ncbi:MAG: DUF423 domain-containing protein [Bacteroidota bacterium]|jgi:uncharacterized membrane protein YgdD (TMEM256/DUF423 family)|nr:DUF423 domain-containing protein [Cytophagales bacterium]MCE2957521.1 DUF423 domain-containing protein [Flammeovirgaceae bacterium]MCZ8071793.1 DUF423 domain-containing protein [Cytophagales bacterium]
MTSQKQIALAGFVLGALAVALGAFGAHALKNLLALSGRTETYELAVKYHFYHSLALLALAALQPQVGENRARWSARLILLGTLLFSGSLYLLAIFETKAVVFVTPVGGTLLIAGWLTAVWGILKPAD